jgi:hypothetical protein
MKQRRITFIFIVSAVLMLLPLGAIADQCIEGDCVNGKGTMVYSTGHKYTGEFKNGMRNGEGFMTLPGSRTLKGRFQYNAIFEGTYKRRNGGRVSIIDLIPILYYVL